MARYLVTFLPGNPIPTRTKYVDDAVGPPDADVDAGTDGVSFGSVLWDGTDLWFCVDATTGAAVWEQINGGGGGASDWFDVTAYGAANDATTNDRTAINLAIADYNAAGGGVLYFPAGAGYRCSGGGLTALTAPGLVLGDGGAETDPASLITMEALGSTLFTASVGGIHFRGIKLNESAGNSTASAVVFQDADMVSVTDCTIIGFERGIYSQVTRYARFARNFIATEAICIHIENTSNPDQGDWSVIDNVLGPGDDNAGILATGSGGGRIIGNKINAGNRTGTTAISWTQTTGSTGILLIEGNSIENTGSDAIDISVTGAATFHSIIITGNQFGLYGLATGSAIKMSADTQGDISRCIIAHNSIFSDGNSDPAIDLTNVTDSYVGPNHQGGFASLLSLTTCDGVVDGTGAIAEGVAITGVPTAGQVPVATGATEAVWDEPSAGTPATTVESETTFGISPAVGTDTEYARQDHTHGTPAEPAGGMGPLLLASDHGTPIVFDDILQASDGSDFLYASEP